MAEDPMRESRMKYVWPWPGLAALIVAMWGCLRGIGAASIL